MDRIVSCLALLALLVSVICAAPAKNSDDTEETKQISQPTEKDTSTNTAEEISDSKENNEEVIRYQDIQVDNDSKVTSENEPEKRSSVQKVAEHILTQNEAIELVTELTDQDYIEQYLFIEGAQGLFDALDMLREQGWITDTEYTIISDSFYQKMMNLQQGPRYDVEYEDSQSYTESDGPVQPVYPITYSSFTDLEQPAEEIQLASLIGNLIERISNKYTTADEGAELIGDIIKLLYGIEESEIYSEWSEPQQFLDMPNEQGYKQDFDIVNSEGRPIGKAEQFLKTYHNDNGALGQELAALEKVTGQIGDNELFQGQGQTYEKEELIPFPPAQANQMFEEEELGSGFESENKLADMVQNYMDSGNGDKFDKILRKFAILGK